MTKYDHEFDFLVITGMYNDGATKFSKKGTSGLAVSSTRPVCIPICLQLKQRCIWALLTPIILLGDVAMQKWSII